MGEIHILALFQQSFTLVIMLFCSILSITFALERWWYFRTAQATPDDVLGHVRKGYGVVIMTNGDNGSALIGEIEARVAAVYGWDSLDKPLVK